MRSETDIPGYPLSVNHSKTALTSLVTACTLVLAACGSTTTTARETVTVTATGTTTAASSSASVRTTTKYGTLQKNVGEKAAAGPGFGTFLDFTLTRIAKNGCAATPENAAEHGRFLVLSFDVQTFQDHQDMTLKSAPSLFNPHSFSLRLPDGTVYSQAVTPGTFGCVGNQGVPSTFGPNGKYRFLIALDSPVDAGSIVFNPVSVDGNGWEWPFSV